VQALKETTVPLQQPFENLNQIAIELADAQLKAAKVILQSANAANVDPDDIDQIIAVARLIAANFRNSVAVGKG
jgi:hypothetical protein